MRIIIKNAPNILSRILLKDRFEVSIISTSITTSFTVSGQLGNILDRSEYVGLTEELKEKKLNGIIGHELLHAITMIILAIINSALINNKAIRVKFGSYSILSEIITAGIQCEISNPDAIPISIKLSDFFKSDFDLNLAKNISKIFGELCSTPLISVQYMNFVKTKFDNQGNIVSIILDYKKGEIIPPSISNDIILGLCKLYDEIKDRGHYPPKFNADLSKSHEKASYLLQYMANK